MLPREIEFPKVQKLSKLRKSYILVVSYILLDSAQSEPRSGLIVPTDEAVSFEPSSVAIRTEVCGAASRSGSPAP